MLLDLSHQCSPSLQSTRLWLGNAAHSRQVLTQSQDAACALAQIQRALQHGCHEEICRQQQQELHSPLQPAPCETPVLHQAEMAMRCMSAHVVSLSISSTPRHAEPSDLPSPSLSILLPLGRYQQAHSSLGIYKGNVGTGHGDSTFRDAANTG